jgi:DNA-directed RNA polymerase specialized sigma24 family protein
VHETLISASTAGAGAKDPVPVLRLEREWEALARGQELRACLARWQLAEPDLVGLASPPALLRFLHRAGENLDRKDAVLAALLRRARVEPLAARFLLQALLPGLKTLAGGLVRAGWTRDEAWEQLLAAAWERIRVYPLERRPKRIAANLLRDSRKTLSTERKRERRHGDAAGLSPDAEPLAAVGLEPTVRAVEAPLYRAVAAGALSAEEAELVLVTRVEGVPLDVVAGWLGCSYNAAKIRRQWAERRLLLYLGYRLDPKSRSRGRSFTARAIGADETGRIAATHASPRR